MESMADVKPKLSAILNGAPMFLSPILLNAGFLMRVCCQIVAYAAETVFALKRGVTRSPDATAD
jgi:hypothetical protein